MSMNLGWKYSLFGRAPSAYELAKKELQMLELHNLHYSNELLVIQRHVTYLEDRKIQLEKALNQGVYRNPNATFQDVVTDAVVPAKL